jgi:hypothetical protein
MERPNSLGPSPQLKTGADPVFETLWFCSYLEFRTKDEVHKPVILCPFEIMQVPQTPGVLYSGDIVWGAPEAVELEFTVLYTIYDTR